MQHDLSVDSLMRILNLEPEQLRLAQTAADEQSQDGPVPLPINLRVRRVEQIVGLFPGQSVPTRVPRRSTSATRPTR